MPAPTATEPPSSRSSAYLDGFEPVEAVLATRDGALMAEVEQAMAGFRTAIAKGEPEAALRQRLAATEALLDRAETALAPEAETAISTFLGAFTILLREGLEALLVVIAMIAFLRKAERTEALPYVHGGWVAALLAGAATWAVATYAIGIWGASRELTEGFGSLLAAVILLSVGIWMHGKAQADEWRRYIAEKMQGALSRGSAWFLFGLAFIVVYREVFETILFFAALWTADNGATILAGALAAIAVLAVIAWADAALQPDAADRPVLPLQRDADGGAHRGPRRQGHRRASGSRDDRRHPARRDPARADDRPVPDRRGGRRPASDDRRDPDRFPLAGRRQPEPSAAE